MLKPKVDAKEFEKFGFKHCKGISKQIECYYLCVAKGNKMLFVSNVCFTVNEWEDDDTRIHKRANCRYRDNRTYLDIIYELIKADMLESDIKESKIDNINITKEIVYRFSILSDHDKNSVLRKHSQINYSINEDISVLIDELQENELECEFLKSIKEISRGIWE
ncbi:hypothetical protein [uncultured Eubacterium sp.]|uniref:hypothetical protein n=1 Tax=uncultured Eubacterium sp. TaxID=165185 RepID=UPI002671026E|nr:hypothetical protein [uncultured Eubacterium sp.]